MRPHRRTAFTLVELLVVIAIIGILIALLLPAVQAARDSARRSQCINNIKQLAIACHNYHDAYKIFPHSVTASNGQYPQLPIPATTQDARNSPNYEANWIIRILPFMEQETLYESFDFGTPAAPIYISNAVNRVARGKTIPTLRCPTDMDATQPFSGTIAGEGDNWARGNYGANGANRQMDQCKGKNSVGWTQLPAEGDINPNSRGKGIMGYNVSLSIGEILDGTSTTLLIGEMRVGIHEKDRRGSWAMGTAGASSLWWHGFGGDCNGPNPQNDQSDDIMGCDILQSIISIARLREEKMGCCTNCDSKQGTCRSRHPGGVIAAFADGSARFIGNRVQHTGPWGPCCAVWDRLITSQDGIPIQSSSISY